MSDKLTIEQLAQSPPTDMFAWAVLHLMSEFASKDMLGRFKIDDSNHQNPIVVELRINGVEVSPAGVFRALDQQHDAMVKRAAMELIEEKCAAVRETSELLERIKALVKTEAAAALGADWEERW